MDMDRNSKSQPHLHSGAVSAKWIIDEFVQFGEVYNRVKLATYFASGKTTDDAGDENVFSPRQFRMESRTELQQSAESAINLDHAMIGPADAPDEPQERGLACSIWTDHSNGVAG